MQFCVIGAGAWGTAFAAHLARGRQPVVLVPRRAEHAAAINLARENTDYLPGIPLDPSIVVSADLAGALSGAQVVLVASPTQTLRTTALHMREALGQAKRPSLVLSLAKGLETGSHLRPSQVLAETLGSVETGALSGPTNAAEVARGLPAAMVLAAARHTEFLEQVQASVSGPTLRVYTSDDLAGVEYGGCLKNVYAIAAGCCDGLGLGDNAKAALLTRAVTEMVRVGSALGSRSETFYGLSGFGDLVATCHGAWSRNREFGQRIGEGQTIEAILKGRRTVVEGYETTRSFHGLCVERSIDAPILREMNAILFQGTRPAAALASLMSRGLKRESATATPPPL